MERIIKSPLKFDLEKKPEISLAFENVKCVFTAVCGGGQVGESGA